MSAFVEIIFDNSDERFPTGKPELILRRTIGIKKDDYSLDRKNATKSDVMNLLESAGFSRSNPYYIVPQGRVTALTNMKDGERLILLKEVAGTQVYEARRTESLKLMADTNNKRAKIDELLAYIKDRLSELEEEKEELKDYQEKDKDRRCLQYTIDHREQVEIANQLDNLDERRQNGADDNDEYREQFIQGEKDLAEIDAEMSEVKQQVEFLKVDKKQLDTERKDTAKTKAKIELQLKGLTDGQSAAQQSKNQYDQELSSVQNLMQEHEQELSRIMPEFVAKQDEEAALKSELDNAEAMRQRLYAKQGRNARFRSKRERDEWLRKEIDDSYPQLAKIKAVRMQTGEEIAELGKEIASLESRISELREQFEQRGSSNEAMQQQIASAKADRDKLMDERKYVLLVAVWLLLTVIPRELWREDAKLDSVLSNALKELNHAEQALSHRMDQNTSRGLAAVRRIKQQLSLEGVYGTLAELLEVSDRFRTAVEVTAGNSLFHYVVDNDETASKVLEILQREKSGRITFMPLNRLRPKPANVPKAGDAVPMMEKIHFEPLYEKAFEQVFGKTVICPNLAVAAQYARSHGVNAITMEGDRSDKRGALTGGYHDPRQSRLEAVKNAMKWRTQYEMHKARATEVKRNLERIDQEITKAVGNLQKLEQTRQKQEHSYGPLRQELQSNISTLQNKRDLLDAKVRARAHIEANVKALTDQQNALEAEMSTDFKKALTPEEETQLENLSSTVQDLRRQYGEVSSSRSELETRKSTLEIELRENLQPRLDQLHNRELDGQGGAQQGNLKQSQKELKQVDKALYTVENKLKEIEGSIDQASSQISELEQRHAETRRQQEEVAKAIEKQQKRMEKSIQKKSLLTKQAAEVSNRISDLGILPQEAFEKYEKHKSDSLVKRLHKVNEALKKYSHVNKKAFQQYDQFTTQRETLNKRREELDSSQASIEELIQVLDQRKDEAIERTFKQVSREFAYVFEKLVPAGKGRLVIQRKIDRQRGEGDEDSEDERRASVENYTGVGISVSFNSKHDDQQRIQQLSGGQKSTSLMPTTSHSSVLPNLLSKHILLSRRSTLYSLLTGLCALALVFAIQRCDPAPFYLFDEIDANLDAQYRTAVAQMLQSISQASDTDGQFICTTFRPEMLLVAEKCYGVRYVGKSSAVVAVSREEAMDFVQGERQ